MNALDLSSIPGYEEAKQREQEARDLAFCDWLVPLCGQQVQQFNLTHLIVLGNCDNAFVSNGSPQPEDVAFFLWAVSPNYRPADNRARDKFVRKISNTVKYVPSCKEIMEYMDTAFLDAPQGTNVAAKSYTSFAATYCDLFADAYGWDDQQTMRKPLARLFQLIRRIQKRNNPKAILFNRSDAVLSKYLLGQASN